MADTTQEHEWDVPEVGGDTNEWGELLNRTIQALDTEVILKDTIANRPAAGTAGRWFLATDKLELWYDNGTDWLRVSEDTRISVSDDGSTIVFDTEDINFSSNLNVADDGDGTVTVAKLDEGTTEYVVGGSDAPYQSIQAALDASGNFAAIAVREDYDAANDTFPLSMSSETLYGAGRNSTVIDVGDTTTDAIHCVNGGSRGPVIKDLTIKNAQWGIVLEGAPISILKDLYITDCEGGINASDDSSNGSTSHHCSFENIRIRDYSGTAGSKAGFFGYQIHNSQFDRFSVIEMDRGAYIRTTNSVTFNSFDVELNHREGLRLLQARACNFNSCYFEGNGQEQVDSYPSVFLQNTEAIMFSACRFNGLGQEIAGIDTYTRDPTETSGVAATVDTHNISVHNCDYTGFSNAGQDGFINIRSGAADDWDLHLNSHTNYDGDGSPLTGDLSGAGRLRNDGIIVGSGLSGIDPTAINGARDGDIALSDGSDADTDKFDLLIWDSSASDWYTDTRTDVSDGGTTVVPDVSDINFSTNLDVTNDGDGTVTVTASGGSGSGVHSDWLHAVDDLGMDDTGTNAVDTTWNNNVADNTTIYFPDGTFLFEEGHLHNNLSNFKVVGEDDTTFLIDDTFSAEPNLGWRYLFIFGQNATNSCTNIQFENIEIDMTTASAGAGSFWCHLDGEDNLILDVDVNGFRDDAIAGSDGEMVMRFDVIGTQSYGRVERFRALDGGANQGAGDPFTGLYVGGATTGSVLLEACAMSGWEDNAIYTSAAGQGGGGNVHILNCYAADTGVAAIRPGGLNTVVEGCYVEQTDDTQSSPRGYYVRDGNTTMKRCYGRRSSTVNSSIIEIIGTTSGGSAAKHTVIEDCLFEADGGTGSLGVVDADSNHPRRFEGCKFTAAGDPGGLTPVLEVKSEDVDLIDCRIDAHPNNANYWYGVAVTAPDCHIKGGMYKSDRRAIWFRTGGDNGIVEDAVAESVSFSEEGIDIDANDVWIRGRSSDITNFPNFAGSRGMFNNTYFDSGSGSPTASNYEPGMLVEWDDTDGSTANDGVYIVSRDGSTLYGPVQ